jgi:propanol-preferring alcohol dehydrogenase
MPVRVMELRRMAPLEVEPRPLVLSERPKPSPGAGEILLRVSTCGVCHTELDEIEGRTPPACLPIVPGHEVIGYVAAAGEGARRFRPGDRVGVGWIHHSSGGERENLSEAFRATGRDADGGYAEYMVIGENYAQPVPERFGDLEAAPLLCAGAVGYRALRLAGLRDGQVLGLTGFGGSGHLVLQVARHLYPSGKVFVFARSEAQRSFAMESGAAWSGETDAPPPEAPHAIIDTTPAWAPILAALRCLRPGGRLVINAIRKEDRDRHLMADINYATQLWMEKEIKTVANVTSADIAEFLPIAARIPLRPTVESFSLEHANEALRALRSGRMRGAFVLDVAGSGRTSPSR